MANISFTEPSTETSIYKSFATASFLLKYLEIRQCIENIQYFYMTYFSRLCSLLRPPCSLTLHGVWGIAYFNDPDSYAGWNFYTPGRPPKSDRLKARDQTK